MKWLKDKTIVCCPEHMAKCLDILTNEPGKYLYWIAPDPITQTIPLGEVYLFKSGAKLGRHSLNRWYIYGYFANGMDGKAAEYELRAADHIRQAMSLLESTDAVLRTPDRFRIKYHGLHGEYNNGQRVPSQLNHVPHIKGD